MRSEVAVDRRNAHQPPVWIKARERKARIVLYSSLAFFAFLLVASIAGQGGIYGVYQLGKKNKVMKDQIARIEAENRSLRVLIESLRNDPHAVEKIAREELGLVKPGEKVYVFVPAAPESAPGSAGSR
ncbi:MAG: septum formation initiator family protein [Candidatus Tectomicrobia bacterium]|uniref:Septum formation initiator family protein n=1 Tax=Tectimicrobiota bacterium TaxID=2528274 RepID=A0A932GMZ1_UNCTE|nr:septum formation initiator family protein [Candidatus Tectomicrobia bacterium]